MVQVDSWAGAAASLVEWGCAIRAADAGGTSAHYDCDWRDASALVVGSEAHGISREVLADPRVHSCSIPMAAARGLGTRRCRFVRKNFMVDCM